MKPSSIVRVLFVALIVMPAENGAAETRDVILQYHGTYALLDTHDPGAARACIKHGGNVSTDKDGRKVCATPEKPDMAVKRTGVPQNDNPH